MMMSRRFSSVGSLARHLMKRLKKAARGIFGLFGFVLFSLLSIVLPLRVGWFTVSRIGHFAHETAFQYAVRSDSRTTRWLDLRCFSPKHPVSNEFLLTMARRNFVIAQWALPTVQLARRLNLSPRWLVDPDLPFSGRDQNGLIVRTERRMEFSADEDASARAWLASIGMAPDEQFVCVMVRDSAYLNETPGHRPEDSGRSWAYHDYRDTPIEDYAVAAEWLAGQGVWVFRMGKIVRGRLRTTSNRVIDYANLPDRSDFLDIWLMANCSLCVSTGTGPDTLAYAHDKLVVHVNFIPTVGMWSWARTVVAPKPLFLGEAPAPLSLQATLTVNFGHTETFREAGIRVGSLAPEMIRDVVSEAWQRHSGSWEDTESDVRRQSAAWADLQLNESFSSLHAYRNPEARFSTVWLRAAEAGRFEVRD